MYAIKNSDGNNVRYKARYVAKGYTQVKDVNYLETYSPTARLTSIRILMNIAINENLILHQMDVVTAYLNADIDYEIYVEQPKGFIEYDNNHVYRLNKSLYGLKQSGRNWNNLLHNSLVEYGFERCLSDNCVYIKCIDDLKIIVIIYVDDLIVATSNDYLLNDIKDFLKTKFRMKDLGVISNFLGIDFSVGESHISMNQSNYINRILSKFRMNDCNSKSVPCDINISNLNPDSPILDDPKIYREIIGSLLYLMTCTRPDICFAVSKLSQFLSNPTNEHLSLSKSILKYLSGTKDLGLKFVKSTEYLNLIGYCDSDWGSSTHDRRSISGYCFKLCENSSLISWRSKRQQTVALSTCEAEYMAITYAIQEGKYLSQLFRDMSKYTEGSIKLFVDNRSAIDLASNPVNCQRSKHIDIKYHYIRTEIKDGNVKLHHIPSNENIADLFTKPLSRNALRKFNICT